MGGGLPRPLYKPVWAQISSPSRLVAVYISTWDMTSGRSGQGQDVCRDVFPSSHEPWAWKSTKAGALPWVEPHGHNADIGWTRKKWKNEWTIPGWKDGETGRRGQSKIANMQGAWAAARCGLHLRDGIGMTVKDSLQQTGIVLRRWQEEATEATDAPTGAHRAGVADEGSCTRTGMVRREDSTEGRWKAGDLLMVDRPCVDLG